MKAVNNVLVTYVMLNSNEPIKVAHLQKLARISKNLHENTYARVSFSLGLTSVISKVSVADFQHE